MEVEIVENSMQQQQQPLQEDKKAKQYIKRCLYNWRKHYNLHLAIEDHEEFLKHKKYYLKLKELNPNLMKKILEVV